jgi:hypothetical protein
MQLLTDTEHSNPISFHYAPDILLAADGMVLCLEKQDTFFDCPATFIRWVKRPYNDAERWHHDTYSSGKPPDHHNRLWAVHRVDWTGIQGTPVVGTELVYQQAISSTSLSDASIALIAFSKSGPVDYVHTSYWVEDRNDSPNWLNYLARKFGVEAAIAI